MGLWILFKSSVLAGSWHCSGSERVTLPCHCQVGVEVLIPHLASIGSWGIGFLVWLDESGNSISPLGLYWCYLVGRARVPHYCSQMPPQHHGRPHYCWAVVKVLTFPLAPLTSPLWLGHWWGAPCYALRGESRRPASTRCFCWQHGERLHFHSAGIGDLFWYYSSKGFGCLGRLMGIEVQVPHSAGAGRVMTTSSVVFDRVEQVLSGRFLFARLSLFCSFD